MAVDTRQKNTRWNVVPNSSGIFTYDQAQLAVLMDIRDELQALNHLLSCPNFVGIPRTLNQIQRNTVKRRRKPTVKA